MRNLNEKQRQAVEHTDGPLLIIAGAGSGKTTVLVERIANIIDQKGVRPYKVLAITFTNKAAGELKSRLSAQLGEQGADVFAATFHSTCVFLLRRFGELLGYPKNFTIYDSDDQLRVIKNIYKLNDIDKDFLPYKAAISKISRFKDSLLSPSDVADSADSLIHKIYSAYQKELKAAGAFDFDDLIFCTAVMLQEFDEVRDYCHNRFQYIMVDEFQDTSIAQFELVSLLTGNHNNLCVVGDDDQSIYRFRGATIENILGFEKHYPDALVIKLEQNYRSSANILNAANSVIENNTARKGKTLFTEASEGEKINFFSAEDEYDEAFNIGKTLQNLLDSGTKLSECAVLYRMNSQSGPIESYCTRSGIPYKLVGGMKFFDRKVIKDILSYLSVITNRNDNLRLMRILNVPARGIGATTAERISDIASSYGITCLDVIENHMDYPALVRPSAKLSAFYSLYNKLSALSSELKPSDVCSAVIEDSGYMAMVKSDKENGESDVEYLTQLVSMIAEYEEKQGEEASLLGFLEEVALFTDLDNYDEDADYMVLMTVHAAKGLEFENVFLVGLEDGIFPMEASRHNTEDLEEERRLCYVALTRAKKRLYISVASKRFVFGQTKYNRPSRFVGEIPAELFKEPPNLESQADHPRQFGNIDLDSYRTDGFRRNTSHKATSSVGRSFSGSAGLGFSDSQRVAPKKKEQTSATYNVGDKVKHSVFGEGVVTTVTPLSGDSIVEINFSKVGVKKTMANYAPMEKI